MTYQKTIYHRLIIVFITISIIFCFILFPPVQIKIEAIAVVDDFFWLGLGLFMLFGCGVTAINAYNQAELAKDVVEALEADGIITREEIAEELTITDATTTDNGVEQTYKKVTLSQEAFNRITTAMRNKSPVYQNIVSKYTVFVNDINLPNWSASIQPYGSSYTFYAIDNVNEYTGNRDVFREFGKSFIKNGITYTFATYKTFSDNTYLELTGIKTSENGKYDSFYAFRDVYSNTNTDNLKIIGLAYRLYDGYNHEQYIQNLDYVKNNALTKIRPYYLSLNTDTNNITVEYPFRYSRYRVQNNNVYHYKLYKDNNNDIKVDMTSGQIIFRTAKNSLLNIESNIYKTENGIDYYEYHYTTKNTTYLDPLYANFDITYKTALKTGLSTEYLVEDLILSFYTESNKPIAFPETYGISSYNEISAIAGTGATFADPVNNPILQDIATTANPDDLIEVYLPNEISIDKPLYGLESVDPDNLTDVTDEDIINTADVYIGVKDPTETTVSDDEQHFIDTALKDLVDEGTTNPDEPIVDQPDKEIIGIETAGILEYIRAFLQSIGNFFTFIFNLISALPSELTYVILGAFLLIVLFSLIKLVI